MEVKVCAVPKMRLFISMMLFAMLIYIMYTGFLFILNVFMVSMVNSSNNVKAKLMK